MSADFLQQEADRLLNNLRTAEQSFASYTEEEWCTPPAPGKWCRKEILGHLIDSAANNHQRFILAQQAETSFTFPAYDQDFFVNAQQYLEADTKAVVALWLAYNRHLSHVIRQVNPAKLEMSCIIGKYEPVTLAFLISDYNRHMEHHLKQIVELKLS